MSKGLQVIERLMRVACDAEYWGHSDAGILREAASLLAEQERERIAFLEILVGSAGDPNERLRRLRRAIVPREVKRAECAECGERGDFSGCPHCGKVVCQLCAEREGKSCCDGEPAADEKSTEPRVIPTAAGHMSPAELLEQEKKRLRENRPGWPQVYADAWGYWIGKLEAALTTPAGQAERTRT